MSFYEGKKELLIIIPAYNEEKSIGAVLDELLQLPIFAIADVLVIDDASGDDTAKLARARGVQVITQMYHMGYGAGLQLGYRYAVLHDFSYVIQMDADGQHDVSNVMKLFDRLRTPDEAGNYPDLILGSRFLEGAPDYPVSFAKKAAYAMFRGIIWLFTGRRITDPTTGLQGLGRRTFTYYAGSGHFDDKYPDANVLLQMLLLDYRVEEIPARTHPRREGVSMHWGLGPLGYMVRMLFSIAAVWMRSRWFHLDTENAVDAEDRNDHLVS